MNRKRAITLMSHIIEQAPHLRSALDIKPIEDGTRYVIWLSGISFFIWNESDWAWCWANPSFGANVKLHRDTRKVA